MPTRNYQRIAILALSLTSSAVHATNGYMSHGYGTTSKGMAGAGSALPQDTLSVFNNPAGLVYPVSYTHLTLPTIYSV